MPKCSRHITNRARHGPESQNREAIVDFPAHLEGRVSFVEMINRDKGQRLRDIFKTIRWAR